MGKLSSKLQQKWKYHRYLFLSEKYMKISWSSKEWIYSKKLPFAANPDFWRLRNLPAFSKISSCKLVNAAVILVPSFSLVLHRIFLVSCSTQYKGIVIWVVRRPDFRGDVFEEIFWQLRLVSPVRIEWHRVFLPDIGVSSMNLLDLEQNNLLQVLDVRWRNYVTIVHLKYHDVDWLFSFHQYEYISVLRSTPKHWNLRTGTSIVNATQYSMQSAKWWKSKLSNVSAFVKDNA